MHKDSMPTYQDVTTAPQFREAQSFESALAAIAKQIDARPQTASPLSFNRIKISIHDLDPLAWLGHQKGENKIYWADRDTAFEMAGLGSIYTVSATSDVDYTALFQRLQKILAENQPGLRFYGGTRFYECFENDATWQSFGTYRFIIPAIEVHRDQNGTSLICNFNDRQKAKYILKSLADTQKFQTHKNGKNGKSRSVLVKRTDIPHEEAWDANISAALHAFKKRQLDKVVLARKSVFEFDEKIDSVSLISTLRNSNSKLFYFLFQFDENSAFLGGSPELLYLRKGLQIKSEAIAGTRPCGATPAEAKQFGADLLACEKDIREHRFVLDSIKNNLLEICETVDTDDQLSLLQLSRVQHLRCRLQGILSPGITDAHIIELMHPTPAVGGIPKEKAIAAIRQLEHFDRGWYAAPVGYISQNEAEFVVAIRSGLVRNNQLSLFSGAGIVEGSVAASEWEEIENKIANFMKAITSR
ncbi:MAG: isochorismate synthase [Calditrichaeota bacterium]|nr:MAG: isochorismate synthase [Calditrichota bacterium]